MKLQMPVMVMALWLLCPGCEDRDLLNLSDTEVNEILVRVDENDAEFVRKGVVFDSVLTVAGSRTLEEKSERVKARLYFFGDRVRGYYNLADSDQKNLQVFGKKVGNEWAIKCVTKLNMEEAGGYILWSNDGTGIWATGHNNFKKGLITLQKQNIDYDDLVSW